MEPRLTDVDSKTLYKNMAKVALPISVQGLITSSLTLIDNLMVGSLGESELSAVGVAGNVFFVFFLLCWGFCAGCSTFLAQFFGAGDMKNIRRTMGFMMCCCAVIAAVFFSTMFFFPKTVLRFFTDIPVMIDLGSQYMRVAACSIPFLVFILPGSTALRSIQKPHIPLATSTVSFATNTFLNYVLIFGHFGAPHMGVVGAALATCIARALEAAIVLYLILGGNVPVSGKIREYFGWSKALMGRVMRNAIPVMLNESLWGLGVTMYAAAFARVSVTAYAAVEASLAINDLFQMAAMGVGDASLILLGQKLGEGKLDEARVYGRKFMRAGLIVGIIVGGLLILAGRPIVSLFDFTPEGAHFARNILIILGILMPVSLINMIIVTGLLRSGGDTRFAMLADAGSVWLLGVPAAFLSALVFKLPIDLCVLTVQFEAFVKLVVVYIRARQEKWVRNVIGGL